MHNRYKVRVTRSEDTARRTNMTEEKFNAPKKNDSRKHSPPENEIVRK